MTRAIRTAVLAAVVGAMAPLAAPSPAWAQGASLEAATPKQLDEAKNAYKKAKRALDQKQLEEALAGFRESYGIVASPNSHLMIARTLALLGRNVEAYQELRLTAEEADAASAKDAKYKKTAESARAEANDVRTKIGVITVSVRDAKPGTTLTLGGNDLPEAMWGKEVPVEPGAITIVLKTEEGPEERREVTVAAGGAATVDISEPSPAAADEPAVDDGGGIELDSKKADNRTLAYIAGGVGVAGLATFAIFGALNNSKFNELEDECPDKRCASNLESDADTGKTYQTIANVGLVVGGIGLAAGAVLFLTSDSGEEKASSTAPKVLVGPGSVTVSGKF